MELKIHNFAFEECSKLQMITIPGNKTVIGINAFTNCKSLRKVTLRNGVKKIGMEAFLIYGTTKLKSIRIPYSVTYLGSRSVGIHEYQGTDKTGCKFSQIRNVKGFIIYCKKGSAAEKYAKKNKITYRR